MDSSDSDDDCYGNTAQRLQKLKNKYTEDKIESTNLLNESSEIEETVKEAEVTAEKTTITADKSPEKVEVIDTEEAGYTAIIDEIIATSSKIVTRSTAKRSASDASLDVPLNTRARRKTRTALNSNVTDLTTCNALNDSNRNRNKTVSRGRRRGRRSNIRGRNTGPFLETSPYIPTYSVGNTDEYPDQSDNQQLFSAKSKSDDIVVIEENDLEENEELSVKVYWQSSEFVKFTIRRYQKLMQIFEYFSYKKDVCLDKLLFTFNDKIISPNDTPDSINYNIVKFIDGGVIKQSVSNLVRKTDKNELRDGIDGIRLKFQCQNVKKPFETVISIDDKLSKAMMLCAEHFEISLGNLKFEFDGDCISGKNTPKELELEGGECIDVKIIS